MGSDKIKRAILGSTVTTLTGRVRGGAEYTEARNTPFQGLAADGAKVAAWALFSSGYRIVAFVHDEFVVEIEDTGETGNKSKQAAVEFIMKRSMKSVLTVDLPVEVESVIADKWVK
jgi:DNA polymerase I-like protein with 3'-5' exonuclease and polymerase domains